MPETGLRAVVAMHRAATEVKKNEKNGDHAEAWLSKNSAGSGAYKITQFDPAIGFVAERFKDHFKGWGPKWIDEIEFRAVKDTNTRVLGLMRGDFNGIGGYLQTDQLNRIKSNPAAQVLEAESMRVMMAQINMTRAHSTTSMFVARSIMHSTTMASIRTSWAGSSSAIRPHCRIPSGACPKM